LEEIFSFSKLQSDMSFTFTRGGHFKKKIY